MKDEMIFLLMIFFVVFLIKGEPNKYEEGLYKYLQTAKYKLIRPVKDRTKPTNVTFSFEISQILEVNDRDQYLKIKTWVRQSWVNEFATWNPKDWNNITTIKVPRDEVWIPDIVLHNNADEGFAGGNEMYKTETLLSYNGFTSWLSPATFKSSCKFDMRNFPYDDQTCALKFGSWLEDSSAIVMNNGKLPVLTSNYYNSSQWEIVQASSKMISSKYACCVNPYSEVIFTLKLKRKSLYYTFNVITPCLVLVVNIFVGFYLPPDCGERVSLTITILLAVAVFLQFFSDSLPKNSDSIPILAIFYILIMTESAFSLITTCVVLILYYHSNNPNPKPVPKWMRAFLLKFLGRLLQISKEKHSQYYIIDGNQEDGKNQTFLPTPPHRKKSLKVDLGKDYNCKTIQCPSPKTTLNGEMKTCNIAKDLYSKYNEDLRDEWRYVAKILDRFFFWMFLITVLSTACGILLPTYFQQADISENGALM